MSKLWTWNPLHPDKTLWVRAWPLPEPRPGSPLQTTFIHYSSPSLLSELSSQHDPWFLVEATNPGRPPPPTIPPSRFAPRLYIVYSVIHPSIHPRTLTPTHPHTIHPPTHPYTHPYTPVHPPTDTSPTPIHSSTVCVSVCQSVSL